jgi:DNA repair exonuclease SbcCD ATPase subunit
MARGQRRLKEEYREFEEEIDDAIEVQGINDKQHKRLRRIRTKLDSMLGDLEIELKELELKKRDDHERLLELLGPDSGK